MNWNFELILFVLLVVTGAVYALDYFWLRHRRAARVEDALAQVKANGEGLSQEELIAQTAEVTAVHGRVNVFVEYAVSFFPVILFVFLLRSFVVEPFRIPSGSMLPTLESGDLILVDKFSYGIRLPVLKKKIISIGSPQRGDVMVFRYPVDPSMDYIKRVVGLPGDRLEYLDKKLFINGKEIVRTKAGEYFEPDRVAYTAQYDEELGDVKHKILLDEQKYQEFSPIWNFPNRQSCEYLRNGVRCTVPEGGYFMMGDNRDNSSDSRYWGFAPDENIVGRAFVVWMNFGNLGRIGTFN